MLVHRVYVGDDGMSSVFQYIARVQVFVVIVVCLIGCAYTAIPNLRGQVINAETKNPIAGAIVDVSGRDGVKEHVVTDSQGFFQLKGKVRQWGWPLMPVPTLDVRISATCYQSYEVVSSFPSFNAINIPMTLPMALFPRCHIHE